MNDKACEKCGHIGFNRAEGKLWECSECGAPLSLEVSHCFEAHRMAGIVRRDSVEPLRAKCTKLIEAATDPRKHDQFVLWACLLRKLRSESKYADNLTAAARAAGIKPSRLHKLEGGEDVPDFDEGVHLLIIYNKDWGGQ